MTLASNDCPVSLDILSTRVEKNGSSLQIVLKAIPEGYGWKIWSKVTGAADWEGYCLPEDFASIQ